MFVSFVSDALETNDVFGFKRQSSIEGYQQYIGHVFNIRKSFGKEENWNQAEFSIADDCLDNYYKILNVKVGDMRVGDTSFHKITVYAVDMKSKRKISFSGYDIAESDESVPGKYAKAARIDKLPVVFSNEFNRFKSSTIGTCLKSSRVRDSVVIQDVYIGKPTDNNQKFAALRFRGTSVNTGTVYNRALTDDIEPMFEYAYEGFYLAMVSKVSKTYNTGSYVSKPTVELVGKEKKFVYTDSLMKICVMSYAAGLALDLHNLSDNTIKIVWDEACFVDHVGQAHRVGYLDDLSIRSKLTSESIPAMDAGYRPLSTIIAGAALTEYISSGLIFPDENTGTLEDVMRLMIPVLHNNVRYEYTFSFDAYYVLKHPELIKRENDACYEVDEPVLKI